MKKNGNNLFEKAVVFAIATLFLGSVFVPVSGFLINSANLDTVSSSSKDLNAQYNPESLKQMQEGFLTETIRYFYNNDLEQKKEKPPLRDSSDPWWNADWGYRKWITIDHTKVIENLIDFPVLISISSDVNLSLYAQDDGDDIVITDKIGNILSHEIELFNGTSGRLVAWVKVPYLSSTVNTELYLYYGNDTAANQENPTAVWDSNYVAVWHLNQDPGTAGSGGINDSTSYANHGTPEGGMTSADQVAAKIGYGIDFDGSNDVIRIDNSAGIGHILDFTNGPFTIEAWFYSRVFSTSKGTLVSKRDNTLDQYQFYTEATTTGNNNICFRAGGEWGYGSSALSLNSWYYGTVVVDSLNWPEIYRDGLIRSWADKTGSRPFVFTHRDVDVSIGARWNVNPTTGYQFDGIIDEVRISNIIRNGSWLSTTYNNYNDPSNFYTIIDEIQIDNYSPSITNENPLHNAVDISCDLPSVSVLINDTEGDLFNWTIESYYLNNAAGNNETNGTKTATLITPLPPGTAILWYVNATDRGSNKWTNKTYMFTTGYPWWDDDWGYRRLITLDHTKVSANQTNFPVLLNILNSSLGFFAQNDGDDFVFTDSNGNMLSHEIELYNSTTGNLIVWVNVTALSSTEDTLLFLYYGNQTCDNQQNPTGVWDAHYVAVWHLAEDPGTAGAGGIKDSTVYANHGTALGGMDSSDQVIGHLGYALDFDGSNDVIRIDNSSGSGHILDFTSGPFTMEAWFRIRTTSDPGTLVNKRNSIGTTHYDQYQFYLQPQLRIRANTEIGYASDTVVANTWHYGVLVVNDTGWPEIYRNGVLKSPWTDVSGSRPYDFIHQNVNVSIGARWENYPTTAFPFKGIIDEVRISNLIRSSDWQVTAFNNYNSPGTFSLIGSEESITGNLPPTFSNEQPQNNAINIPITQATVSVNITDMNGDLFDWTIQGMYVTSASANDDSNGTKSADLITPLPYSTSIIWYVNATDGNYTRATYSFMTRDQYMPNPPTTFIAKPVSVSQIDLGWVKAAMADTTYIERNSVASWDRGDGILIYNDTGVSYHDTGLSHSTPYYYQAWSYNHTDRVYSTTYVSAQATIPTPIPLINWSYRKAITINHSLVAEDLMNFPVLIQISGDVDLVGHAQDDGDDLLFTDESVIWVTDDNYQRLQHEIEAYDSVNGDLLVWVNVTGLSSTTDTVLYLYYGNAGCENQQNPENVWCSSYHGVWHLNNNVLDSTGYGNDGTNYGSTDRTGMIGNGRYFDGNDYIVTPQHCLGVANNWTASCWFRSNSSSTKVYHYLLSTGGYTGYGAAQLYHNANEAGYPPLDEMRARLNDGNSGNTVQIIYHNITTPKDEWHLAHLTWDASSFTLSLYINGTLINQSMNSAVDDDPVSWNPLTIGRRSDGDSGRYHVGEIDEIRISNPVKSAGWITTEYNNQYAPHTFSSIGPEQSLTNYPPVIKDENPVNNSIDIDIYYAAVSVTIEDPDNNLFNWTIQGAYVNNAEGNNETGGTKSATLITPLPYNTNIIWYVNASDGINSTYSIYSFTTRPQFIPAAPSDFTATPMGRTRIDLSWTKGDKAYKTYIERSLTSLWNRGEGTLVYNDTGTAYQDTGLSMNVHYYYQAWSWNETDAVFSALSAAADATTFENHLPYLCCESPANNTGNVPITTPIVSVQIEDQEGDVFDWTIEGPYVTSASAFGDSNGTKTASLSTPLPYSTDIVWYVNATDGYGWSRTVYNFTTRSKYIPEIPTDFTATPMGRTRIDLSWTKGDKAYKTYIERSLTSLWNRGEGTLVYNDTGTAYQDTGLSMNVQYYYQAWSWNETDAVFSSLSAAADATTFQNQLPVFSGETPANNSEDIAIVYPSVSVFISDPEGDLFDWTIQGPYVISASANGDSNGTKTANLITPLPYNTSIIWYVNATDGYGWTREVYTFTTEEETLPGIPTVTLIYPEDNAEFTSNVVNFSCTATDDISIHNISLFSNIDGPWRRIATKNAPIGEYVFSPSMYLWMHFNKDPAYGETNTHVYDFSGKGNNGTVTGDAVHTINGKYGGAYIFDGVNDVIRLPNAQYGFPGQPGATMAAWVNPTSGQTAASGTILFLDNSASASSTRMLISVNNDRTVSVKARSATESLITVTTTDKIPFDSWSHIVATVNLTSKTMQIYFNGTLSRSQSGLGFTSTTFASTTTINAGIGGIYNVANYYYKGLIDEAAIFNQVLTTQQAQDLYNGTRLPEWNASFTVTDIPLGTYQWNCQAYDIEGNSAFAAANRTVTISGFPPIVTLLSPENNTAIDGTTATFTVMVNDTSGIRNVSLFTDITGAWELTQTKVPKQTGEYNYDPTMELWMHFNKDSAYGETDTFVYDFSGKGHHGTAANGAYYIPNGKFGGAFAFDGDNDVIRLGSGTYSLPGKPGATMAAWVNPSTGQASASGTILFIDRAGTTTTRMLISVNNDGTVSVKGRSHDETFQVCTTTQTIPYDTWTHIIGVINLTANSMQVYINGELAKIQTMAFTQSVFADTTATNPGIGAISGSTLYTFKGAVDEAAIFPRILNDSELFDLYQGSTPTSCEVSFQVDNLTEGVYHWNCLAVGNSNLSAWAQSNWTFEVMKMLSLEFVPPTPDHDARIWTDSVTINVSANRNLSSCTLSLLNDSTNNNIFTITIDPSMWSKWGFKYPTTYVFNLSDVTDYTQVEVRDTPMDIWRVLNKKTSTDFFNGIECVRFDTVEKKAYVSVGFNTSNTVYLRFVNVTSASYDSVANYYDNRKATYTLSNDNWGRTSTANPGAPWQGMTNDASDKYQASVHATRMFNIPQSIAINSAMAGGSSMWQRMQEELNYSDFSWEPTVHTRTHPCSSSAYLVNGYAWEILGCRDDILSQLSNIPYGQHIFEFILPCGYKDVPLQQTSAGEFLFLRDWTGSDHMWNYHYAPWNTAYNFYGIGGLETKAYDVVFQSRSPAGRYYASDVANLNDAFTTIYNQGGIFYAMFHSDRYQNSVIYDPSPGVDGVSGSTLMQHLAFVANRTDVWYVANGWLYSYHYVAENVEVSGGQMHYEAVPMTVYNDGENTYATCTLTNLSAGTTYYYSVTAVDTSGHVVHLPTEGYRNFTICEPSAWWNTNWLYRKQITIDHTKVAGDLSNFPVLIAFASDADLADKTQPDGDDIVFTTYDGTTLCHEIEYYNSTTGQLVAWVNVTSLSSTQNTILYLYYGNAVCGNQQDSAGTWGARYRMVHHLSETTGVHGDSTLYGNHGTYYGSTQDAAGIIDGANQFVGDLGNVPGGDYVDCGNASSLNLNTAITVSSWIKPADQVNWNHICTKGANSPNRVYQLSIEANETIDFIINGDSTNGKATTSISVPVDQWSYVIGTYDGSTIKVYINGVLQASKSYTTPINTNAVHLFIGGRVSGTGNTGDPIYTFNGTIDEVRISDNAHSAAWILTEYYNQYDPSGFFQIGTEEQRPQLEYFYRIPVEPRWNLVSMPFNRSQNKSDIIISYNGTDYTWDQAVGSNIILGVVYNWNRTAQSYNMKEALEPGFAYWMWAYHPCDLVICLDQPYQDGSLVSALEQRWNIMGLPYNMSLEKQNIIVHYNGSDYTWQQATTGSPPIILQYIYGWNRSSQIYALSDQLDAGHGYWMYAYQQCVLKK